MTEFNFQLCLTVLCHEEPFIFSNDLLGERVVVET